MTTKELKLDLLENGIDFIRYGIEQFFEYGMREPKHHKYALLHLFSGTLLLLKEKLRREHPSLIWDSVTDLDDESARTVDFDQAIQRVKRICSVDFTPKQEKLLRWCQKKRNALEHYSCNLNLHESQKRISELVDFIDWFMSKHLLVELRTQISAHIWEDVRELTRIGERLKREELETWRQRSAKYFSLSDEELENLIETEPYHPKHNPCPQEFMYCPACNEEAVVIVNGDTAVCTNLECREVVHLGKCERCGNSTMDGIFCDDCMSDFDRYMERD